MDNNIFFNVVWVDDQIDDIMVWDSIAREYGLLIHPFSNWMEARAHLETKYAKTSAIIFDFHCKLDPKSLESNSFLKEALSELSQLDGRYGNGRIMPWYVCTAGSADGRSFEDIIGYSLLNNRMAYDADWKLGYYSKVKPNEIENELFPRIKKTIENSNLYFIRSRYQKEFQILDSEEIFDNSEASDLMLEILSALYFESYDFRASIYYTQLRRMLEFVFRSMGKHGILPSNILINGKVSNQLCSLYLAGENVNAVGIRYGNPGDRLFPNIIANIVRNILDVSNAFSHTKDNQDEFDSDAIDTFFKELGSNNMLFGLALQMCDVIVWYGSLLRLIEEGKLTIKKDMTLSNLYSGDSVKDYENQTLPFEYDEVNDVYHCGKCMLNSNYGYEFREKSKNVHLEKIE